MSRPDTRPWTRIGAVLGLGVAALFLYAGLAKIAAPGELRAAIAYLGVLPNSVILSVAVATLVGLEVWIGATLLVFPHRAWPPVTAVAYLVVVSAGYLYLRSVGFEGDCGCNLPIDAAFGSAGVVARNGVLMFVTLLALHGHRRVRTH